MLLYSGNETSTIDTSLVSKRIGCFWTLFCGFSGLMTPRGMEVSLCCCNLATITCFGISYYSSVLIGSGLIFLAGTFKLSLQFSEDYPNKPPTVRFVSRMFHPNSKLIEMQPSLFFHSRLMFSFLAHINFLLLLYLLCSLCRWEYLLGHSTKPVESNIWCCCYTYLHPGNLLIPWKLEITFVLLWSFSSF